MRMSFFGRKRVLALLARGMNIDEVVRQLAKRHPYNTPEEIRRAYFSLGGKFALAGLEGADRETLLAKLREMNEQREKIRKVYRDKILPYFTDEKKIAEREAAYRAALADPKKRAQMQKTLAEMWKRPAFRKAVKKQSRTTMKGFLKQPEFREKLSERSRKFFAQKQSDPEFIKKRDEGLSRYYKEHPEAKEKRRKMLRKIQAGQKGKPQNPKTIEARAAGLRKYYAEHPEAKRALAERLRQIHEEWNRLRAQLKAIEKKPYERRKGLTRAQIEERLRELDQFYHDILMHLPKEERLEYLKKSQRMGRLITKTSERPTQKAEPEKTEAAATPKAQTVPRERQTYVTARAEFIQEQHLNQPMLERMENAFKQAYMGGQNKDIERLAQTISQQANIAYMKAYVFTSWALVNKWPELIGS